MSKTNRLMTRRQAISLAAINVTALPVLGCTLDQPATPNDAAPIEGDVRKAYADNIESRTTKGTPMQVHYLEIVTKDVEASCKIYSTIHGLTFAEADPNLGGARTAEMTDGGVIGIRAPMHDGEKPVTRAYVLVDDIKAAVAVAKESGAEIAVPPMEIPGHGTCAIYLQGGIESGLWQL